MKTRYTVVWSMIAGAAAQAAERLSAWTDPPPKRVAIAEWDSLEGMPSGRVKFFNTDRGYGFIAPDDGGPDVFMHVHDIEAAGMKILVAGQLVAYEIGPARDGRSKAVKLRVPNP